MVNKLLGLRGKKAFTLMELLIVIAIIAILTVSFLPGALKAPAKARDAVRIKQVMDIQAVVESYIASKSAIPAAIAGDPVNCFTDNLAKSLGMDAAPKDASKQGTCVAAGVVNDNDLFYYRSVAGEFYIIGSEVEIITSGNTSLTFGQLNEPVTSAKAKLLIEAPLKASDENDINYFLAIGPVQ